MGPIAGVMLVLALMFLIFLGPEWAVALRKGVRDLMDTNANQ